MLDLDLVPRGDVASRLKNIFDSMEAFCKLNSIPLHMTMLTRALLGYQRECDYPAGKPGCMKS